MDEISAPARNVMGIGGHEVIPARVRPKVINVAQRHCILRGKSGNSQNGSRQANLRNVAIDVHGGNSPSLGIEESRLSEPPSGSGIKR